ncbi:hypothetical protein TWF594_004310 [Orbilia oligospora]|nr:hypothetical protein TWF594_004310 [Orbilia oligospora]
MPGWQVDGPAVTGERSLVDITTPECNGLRDPVKKPTPGIQLSVIISACSYIHKSVHLSRSIGTPALRGRIQDT